MIQSTLSGKINDETLEAYCELNVASNEKFVFFLYSTYAINEFVYFSTFTLLVISSTVKRIIY